MSAPLESLTLELCEALSPLRFAEPVHCVYNPLEYARKPHTEYLKRFGRGSKRVIFLGMNPGPWGMAQTGVPFGEIPAVRDWMGIDAPVGKPDPEHPKRPIEGFACQRSEVSGRRLWGLFAERFGTAEAFFDEHFVLNFCPLVWMEESWRNRTPNKLPAHERAAVDVPCQRHLRGALEALQPEWAIGVGAFAEAKLAEVTGPGDPWTVSRVLHPSPASPAANRGWSQAATRQLLEAGVWI
jgi:single-strand selective monofunctional uracil DNA glycosylase